MNDAISTLTLYQHADMLARRLADEIATATRTADEILVLHLIDSGVNRSSDIADALQKASPTISHILSRFVRDGLITREQHETDGRVRVLELTPEGKNLLDFVLGTVKPVMHGAQFATKLRRAATGR